MGQILQDNYFALSVDGVMIPRDPVYLRTMGRYVRVQAIAINTAAANRYCELCDRAGVLSELSPGGLCLIANVEDKGKETL